LLDADIGVAKPMQPPNLDKAVNNYLSGILWSLSVAKENKELPYATKTGGPMGHGYAFVARLAIESVGVKTWWAKLPSWSFSIGTTGKAWDSKTPDYMRRIEALVRHAAKRIKVDKSFLSYKKPFAALLGKEVKSDLNFLKKGILRPYEIEYLQEKYKKPLDDYNHLKGKYESITDIKELSSFIDVIVLTNSGLKEPCTIADKLVTHRALILYPKDRKARKNALKKTIESLLEEMDLSTYIMCMDPSIMKGFRPFRLDDKLSEKDLDDLNEDDCDKIRQQYLSRVRLVWKKDKSLSNLCAEFYDRYIGSTVPHPNNFDSTRGEFSLSSEDPYLGVELS
jgi:hypothetical protein